MTHESIFKLKYNDTVSSLSQAAAIGDRKAVQALLNKGRLPQATDNRGWSAVHSCVAAKQLEALKLMLNFRKGSKKYLANLSTWEGESPLVIALKGESVSLDIVRLLLESGSNPNTATNEGMTPLHYSCKKNGNYNVVKLLIRHGASVDSKEYINEYTPLHFAIVEAADVDIIKLLVERCDVNIPDADCETPLYKASVCNFFEAVELILKKNTSSVNVIPQSRFSPLSAAALNGNLRLVKLLLDNGASAVVFGSGGFHRYPLNEGNTLPVHLAVGHPDIFQLLLEVTSPPTLLDHEEITPLAVYAMMYGPGSECFDRLQQAELPKELEPLQFIDSDRVTGFIMDFPHPCDEIIEKFHLLFKYCIYLDAENVFKRIAGTVSCYGSRKLLEKLHFLHLLANIGVSSAGAFESKSQVIHILREGQQEKEGVTEVIQVLCRPVLTLKQMSRVAVRRFITSSSENSRTAYAAVRDFHLPADLKQFLWCQVFN